ncbi:MAG: serine hydrolase domain-containing protein [Wujia sp.]
MVNYRMPSLKIEQFMDELANDKRIGLSSITILKDKKLLGQRFVAPYDHRFRHVTYSVCKSVTGMAVGFALEEGLFSLDDKLVDLLPEYTPILTRKHKKQVTVRHLLTMTSGAKFDEAASGLSDDWCKSFMAHDFSEHPGKQFQYNSLNTYILSALIKKKAQCGLLAYLQPRLFTPLDIHDVSWETCPKNIEQGGWGMKMSVTDMLKLGQLYLNHGTWTKEGKTIQVLPKKWVEASTQCHVHLDTKLVKGYGYQLWLLQDGAYLFNGLFGQNIYIHPKQNLVIVTTASGQEIFPDGPLLSKICDFVSCSENWKKDPLRIRINRYMRKVKSLFVRKKHLQDAQAQQLLKAIEPYCAKAYKFTKRGPSLAPVCLQVSYRQVMRGISGLVFMKQGDSLYVCLKEEDVVYRLPVGFGQAKPYGYKHIRICGKDMPVAARLSAQRNRQGTLYFVLDVIYLEEAANKKIYLRFGDNQVDMIAMDSPDPVAFLQKLTREPWVQTNKIFGTLAGKTRKFLFTQVQGKVQ